MTDRAVQDYLRLLYHQKDLNDDKKIKLLKELDFYEKHICINNDHFEYAKKCINERQKLLQECIKQDSTYNICIAALEDQNLNL